MEPPRQQGNTAPGICLVVAHIALGDVPLRPVETQCFAGWGLDLDEADVLKPSLFQAECLAACTRTNFD